MDRQARRLATQRGEDRWVPRKSCTYTLFEDGDGKIENIFYFAVMRMAQVVAIATVILKMLRRMGYVNETCIVFE